MRRLAFYAICGLYVLTAESANAQTISLSGRWEHVLTASAAARLEPDVSIELAAPSGRSLSVPAFWDGGTTWRVRFMPTEEGTWHYRSRSIPPLEGLDGVGGSFICRRQSERLPFLTHGPLRISANRRFFEHADGTPFLWLGDTTWYGAILSSTDDWDTYLDDRAAKGFTVVHFNAIAPRNGVAADENGETAFTGSEYFRLTSTPYRLLSRLLNLMHLGAEEHVRLNPRFYQRLDHRVDAVNSHGLLAAIVLTWGLGPDDSGNALPESEVVRVIRYLESRYGANHVVWILTGDNRYEGLAGERWKRIGRAAFDGRAHAPVTTHPWGMAWPWNTFQAEKWLDFLVYQSGHGDDASALSWIHSGPPAQHWRDSPPRPMINLEPPYEGHLGYQSHVPHSDYSTRRAIYWSLLNAPTAGVTYGAHGLWSWHTAVGQPPTDHPTTGIARTWREALSYPGSTQMKYLKELFDGIEWWRLAPDPDLVAEQPSDVSRHISSSRSSSGDLTLIYLPTGGILRLRQGIFKESSHAQWFNPRTGGRLSARPEGAGIFLTPDLQDWVLLLTAK